MSETTWKDITELEGGLVVSCQASEGEPLCRPEHIVALCQTVLLGGARALRLEGVDNIRAVRAVTDAPIIGLTKLSGLSDEERLRSVYITPTLADARELARAGADIIALDMTGRERGDGLDAAATVERIHQELARPVWADIATFDQGLDARRAGADIVSTTLYGYTSETTPSPTGPGLDLLQRLVDNLDCPVALEGRVWSPTEVVQALTSGAYCVVVGSAITRPHLITRRFANAARQARVEAASEEHGTGKDSPVK